MKKDITSLDYSVAKAGEYEAKLVSYEMPEEVAKDLALYGKELKKPYIQLEIKTADGEELSPRLYLGKQIPYFMNCMARQTQGAIAGLKTLQLLDWMKEHTFKIWVTYDLEYGMQYNWQAPRE